MKLSIAMMIKNESKHLDECLTSLHPILEQIDSELIIVDTGSEDNSVEIAKKHTNKIYFHKWNNDFSEMRNISISYCAGEWIFIIDGDEVLENANDIIEFFKSNEYEDFNTGMLLVKSPTREFDETSITVIESFRLFKNDEFKYEGAVHNQPKFKNPIRKLKSSLMHYGYLVTDRELVEKKFKRTSGILKSEIEKNPTNVYYLFQLSATYSMHDENLESLKYAKQAYDLVFKEKDRIPYRYVYLNYASVLIANLKYEEAEKIALEGIEIMQEETSDKVDFYYYLGICQAVLKNNDEAIKNLQKHLILLDKYENGEFKKEISFSTFTIGLRENVNCNLSKLFYAKKNYKECAKYLYKLKSSNIIKENIEVIIRNFIAYDINELRSYYDKRFKNNCDELIPFFLEQLDIIKESMDKGKIDKIDRIFMGEDNVYEKLNTIRVLLKIDSSNLIEEINRLFKNEDILNLGYSFGALIYILIRKNASIITLLSNTELKKLNNFLMYLDNKYSDFKEVSLLYINHEYDEKNIDIAYLAIMKTFSRYFLGNNELHLNSEEYLELFEKYINIGSRYIKSVYNSKLIEDGKINLIENINSEDVFLMYMIKAEKYRDQDKNNYLKYLDLALREYPYMKKGIELTTEAVEKEISNENFKLEEYKKEVKSTIKKLIDNRELDNANNMIKEYEEIIKNDVEILLLKSELKLIQRNVIN